VPTKKLRKKTRNFVRRILSSSFLSDRIFAVALLVIAIVLLASIMSPIFLSKYLTTTVTGATESLTLSLREKTQSSWVLPAGYFLVPAAMHKIDTCAELPLLYGSIPQGFRCHMSESVRLVVDGAADVHWEVTPEGKWSMLVNTNADMTFTVSLFDEDDAELLKTSEEVRFSTRLGSEPEMAATAVRLPLVASTAVLGSHARYASSIEGNENDFWQPTLLTGNVVTFGKNRPDEGKYHILDEALDSGDVVYIDSFDKSRDESRREKDDAENDEIKDSIWGVVTLEERAVSVSDTTEVTQFMIHAVLHTTHRTLTVRRFGAARHKIKASNWSIVYRWPWGQKLWVIFVSVTGALAFALQLSDWIASRAAKSEKKK